MAQTYFEQYCTGTTLTIDQRTELLCHAEHFPNRSMRSPPKCTLPKHSSSTSMVTNVSYIVISSYLAECKLIFYYCKQRVRHGSVPFSCASCRVASYCSRKHQKLTWKNERICHKELCPLLGYWRMSKKGEMRRESNGLGSEDRCEYVKVFETFFESTFPHVKACVPLYYVAWLS